MDVALEGGASVDEFVRAQLALVRRRVAADVAQVVLLVAMHDHVTLERVAPLERRRAQLKARHTVSVS